MIKLYSAVVAFALGVVFTFGPALAEARKPEVNPTPVPPPPICTSCYL